MAKRRRPQPTIEDVEYMSGVVVATAHFISAVCLAFPSKRKRIQGIFESQATAVIEELLKRKPHAVGAGYVEASGMISDFLSGKRDEPPTITH